jgi:hypothetical protein
VAAGNETGTPDDEAPNKGERHANKHPRRLRSAIDRWIEDGCPLPGKSHKAKTR